MESIHAKKAKELFNEGYNCSQAVVGAFAEELGLDLQTALKIASPFGGGMGRMREVCGAVSGMFMVAGLAEGYCDPKDYEGKKELYAKIREMAEEFKSSEGSIICRELLEGVETQGGPNPEKRTEQYYKKRPCPELVARAAEIAERFIEEQKNKK
ncbi:MAG: C_GCAxxG_C_C family protein [Clostridia bacterium]|nr:C_GCAxxG_C_C family protein [Clostridia bacterium]